MLRHVVLALFISSCFCQWLDPQNLTPSSTRPPSSPHAACRPHASLHTETDQVTRASTPPSLRSSPARHHDAEEAELLCGPSLHAGLPGPRRHEHQDGRGHVRVARPLLREGPHRRRRPVQARLHLLHAGRRARGLRDGRAPGRHQVRRQHERVRRRAGAGHGRVRPQQHQRGLDGHRQVARQAHLHQAPDAQGDRHLQPGGRDQPARPGDGRRARAEAPVARGAGRVHPLGLRAHVGRRRVRRLVLPVPRLALRPVGPHPQGPRAAEPRDPALPVHRGEQDPARLSVGWCVA